MFAFQLESEVVCQMSALVIASEQPKGVGVPNFQRPEIQNTLSYLSAKSQGSQGHCLLQY